MGRGAFKDYVDIILLFLDRVDLIVIVNVDKNDKFLATYPPPFTQVVIECPP